MLRADSHTPKEGDRLQEGLPGLYGVTEGCSLGDWAVRRLCQARVISHLGVLLSKDVQSADGEGRLGGAGHYAPLHIHTLVL